MLFARTGVVWRLRAPAMRLTGLGFLCCSSMAGDCQGPARRTVGVRAGLDITVGRWSGPPGIPSLVDPR